MDKKRALLFILFINFICQGQVAVTLLDSLTREPISYAVVFSNSKNLFGYTNSDGIVKFKDLKVVDTLNIRQLGYSEKKIIIDNVKKEVIVNLRNVTYGLPQITVTPKEYTKIELGTSNNKADGYLPCTNDDWTIKGKIFKLPIDKSSKIKVNSISFYITNKGNYQTCYRLRIYKFDPIRKVVGEDILNQSVIGFANKKNEWHSLNLDSLNIDLTDDYILVAMEWLPIRKNYEYSTSALKSKYYGQVLGCDKSEGAMWAFNNKTSLWYETMSQTTQLAFSPMIRLSLLKYE